VLRLGGLGGAASLPPCPPWLNSWAGTEPERSGGGVRLMLNRVNLTQPSEAHAEPGELNVTE
jgi:hypothetical protein